ncbi:MAG: CPBP family intramembrane metalloprotease [Clostridiales bacterium]|nr:CPBP family intramembrane metalloprotease [Clostridiales bacterium]
MNKKPFRATDGPMIMLIAFALMLVGQLVASFVLIGTQSDGAYQIINVLAMIAFQIIYLATYLIYTKKKGIVSAFSVRNKITVWAIIGTIGVTVLCFFGFIGLAYYFEYLLGGLGYTASGFMPTTPLAIALMVIATVIAAPVGEETIFRSALLSGLIKNNRSELMPCIISGICFALMHINPSQTVYQFCLGFVAAYLTLKCRSVLPAMVTHGLSNALALIFSYTKIGGAIDGFYAQSGLNAGITLLTCVAFPIVAGVAIWLVCKYLKKVEKAAFPDKFKLSPRVIWIDETTNQPIYEPTEYVASIDGEGESMKKSSVENRLAGQERLMSQYQRDNEESGIFGKSSYKVALGIYFVLTVFMWIINFAAGIVQ